MMTNPQTEATDTVHMEIQKSAMEISSNVSQQLMSTANLLEQIAPDKYGLLITSLRWHASQTASGDFLPEYSKWVASNLNYEYV